MHCLSSGEEASPRQKHFVIYVLCSISPFEYIEKHVCPIE